MRSLPRPAGPINDLTHYVLARRFASDALLAVQQLHTGVVNFCVLAVVNFSVHEHNMNSPSAKSV